MEFYYSSFSACGDARGYIPKNHRRISNIRTRPRPAGVIGILQFLFPACEDARGYTPENHQLMPSLRTRPRPAGVSGILQFLFSACEDARGYSPENHRRISSFRTRPRPAGVNGILQFLFLRVRGRTRVRSRELPANPQLTYPPASRGREWNFSIPLSACEDARGYGPGAAGDRPRLTPPPPRAASRGSNSRFPRPDAPRPTAS